MSKNREYERKGLKGELVKVKQDLENKTHKSIQTTTTNDMVKIFP